jgi:hypothetical protein
VSAIKVLTKLTILLILGAAIAGVVALVRQPKHPILLSYDKWPEVPRRPTS